ncbi:PadR family transcriptional regulator [Saccharolobus islandicus]|uniref:Transcriptional regulator PadR family protein n=3 Tax=Saccharolobus islandicus TaxID=43080 RepID=F0NE81_SACI5|nr:PadR family transcriptional regulator [Sulfolobus islandicus]ADX81697.1 transcriptional regulator PadR family protein [Sulfolobus islandicus HVE10/4]ADX84417.1 transcriptional regulator PadR family protein [Sulfolobus islandicus REY15A]AGJ61788.1 putative transcriptional regulators [Sulfolobus islandicus LAL14/1]WCM36931.1 PadR family transcriptional regulator [Sulfolobus islandicus]
MSELIVRQKGRLRLMTLWLLWQSPKRGIDIIDDINKMSWGFWKPSPGSIYPLLNKMVEEGTIERTSDGKYKITAKGIEEIKEILPIKQINSIEDSIQELEGLAQFFKEVEKNKLFEYKERILNAVKEIEEAVKGA